MDKVSLGIISAITLLSGCGLSQDGQGEGEVDQALSADFVDSSGTVTVRIKECPAVGFAEHNTTTCAVDPGFVLVGGGAEILGEDNPGALLTASFPDTGLTTWTASSKDHVLVDSHQLAAYSVGLQLAGVSSTTLRSAMTVVSARSTLAEQPTLAISVPSGFKLIGGGARANWITEGLLLVSSFPSGSQWIAAAKDHVKAESGTVDAFAIGITSGTIPGFGSLDVATNVSSTSVPLTGYGTANRGVPTGWVLASIGGNATYTTQGRMLTDLIPFVDAPSNATPGATVRSKDHVNRDSGTTTAFVLSIRKH